MPYFSFLSSAYCPYSTSLLLPHSVLRDEALRDDKSVARQINRPFATVGHVTDNF